MVAVVFIMPDANDFATRQEMPAVPNADSRICIGMTDYICGHAYWYVDDDLHPKQWIARIKLYLPDDAIRYSGGYIADEVRPST